MCILLFRCNTEEEVPHRLSENSTDTLTFYYKEWRALEIFIALSEKWNVPTARIISKEISNGIIAP